MCFGSFRLHFCSSSFGHPIRCCASRDCITWLDWGITWSQHLTLVPSAFPLPRCRFRCCYCCCRYCLRCCCRYYCWNSVGCCWHKGSTAHNWNKTTFMTSLRSFHSTCYSKALRAIVFYVDVQYIRNSLYIYILPSVYVLWSTYKSIGAEKFCKSTTCLNGPHEFTPANGRS